MVSSFAVDGFFNTNAWIYPYCAVTVDGPGGPNWLMVDLQNIIRVGCVILTNREDCCSEWQNTFESQFIDLMTI